MSSATEGEAIVKQESLDSLGTIEVDIEVQTEPIIVHQGRYRLYRKPDGGLHLVYQRDDSETADHMELPAQLLKLAELAGEGKLTLPQMLAEIMKLRNTM